MLVGDMGTRTLKEDAMIPHIDGGGEILMSIVQDAVDLILMENSLFMMLYSIVY